MQNTAAHCSTLQHTATRCNTLQRTATHCNTLQHTATHCNTLQHTALFGHTSIRPVLCVVCVTSYMCHVCPCENPGIARKRLSLFWYNVFQCVAVCSPMCIMCVRVRSQGSVPVDSSELPSISHNRTLSHGLSLLISNTPPYISSPSICLK